MNDLIIYNARIFTLEKDAVIENGYILIKEGLITEIASGSIDSELTCNTSIDACGMTVMPSLSDCHTHLMEYATTEVHNTLGKGQKMAGIANLLTALKSGITSVGEHHLGHPVLSQDSKSYKQMVEGLPIDVKLACGCCFLGTDPLTFVSSTHPGQVVQKEKLGPEYYRKMAAVSDFAGENIFLNATVANLPAALAPRAGEVTYSPEELADIVGVFHDEGKKIGAHIEGDQAALEFIKAGGDVIHHGHNLSSDVLALMAEKNIPLVITPHGGTSARPNSPEEAFDSYTRGVKIAIASDSYLPLHPEASWIDLPADHIVGPEDFLTIAGPLIKYFIEQGVSLTETLKLITSNPREILGYEDEGILKKGNRADLIVCTKIPAVESSDPECIKYVVKDGEVVVARK